MDISLIINYLQDFSKNMISQAIAAQKWKKLFSQTGDFILHDHEMEESFKTDLQIVFSPENMRSLAAEMNTNSGIDFQRKLYESLYRLFEKYEMEDSAEPYIQFFTEKILQYLKENDPEKHLASVLSEWESNHRKILNEIKSETHEILIEIRKANQKTVKKWTIQEIDNGIKKQAKYALDLSFFDWDDEAFKLRFGIEMNKTNSMIFIEGKSKEETLYRVLNLIHQHYSDKTAWIIKDPESWTLLEEDPPRDYILIPYFYCDSITAIAGNTTIFIYSEEENCPRKEKIRLHRRTVKNLQAALEKAGIEYDEAHRLLSNTHGLYASLKRKLFNIDDRLNPEWVNQDSEIVLTALLCGQWTDVEGDREVFEHLSGKTYEECLPVLEKYEHGANPLVITHTGEKGQTFQIASIEEAWVALRPNIRNKTRDEFIKTFVDVLSTPDHVYDSLEEYIRAAEQNQTEDCYSKAIKKGMIRTFILWTTIDAAENDQSIINKAVEDILSSIDNPKKWESIADYFPDLCEAAPEPILDRLESEITDSSGMKHLFSENKGYTSILWAVEELIQQKPYVIRTIKWLWEMDSYNYQYKISNSPRSILELIFCAWYNATSLKPEHKIREARQAIDQYENAWELIANCLPKTNNTIFTTLYKPWFKEVELPDDVYVADANQIFIEYLNMCTEATHGRTERCIRILKELPSFEKSIVAQTLEKVYAEIKGMNDRNKTRIKEQLRHIIYDHRYFTDASWVMQEDTILLFEELMNRISIENPVYDYLYLFHSPTSFPLLHPVPKGEDTDWSESHRQNEELANVEIRTKIQEFKEKNLSIKELIELALEQADQSTRPANLGVILACEYDRNQFDEEVFGTLVRCSKGTYPVYSYARQLAPDLPLLKKMITLARKWDASLELIADIISLQIVDDFQNAVVFQESEELKKVFWTRENRFLIADKAEHAVLQKAINECHQFGDLKTYTELLYQWKDQLSMDELYQFFTRAPSLQPQSEAHWYFAEILELLQKRYIDDSEKCFFIAKMEWWAGNMITWEQMLCTQKMVREDVRVYAGLVNIVCRKDSSAPEEPGKKEMAAKLYGKFREIHFCPAEKNGKVQYQELKQWVDDFKAILEKQNQAFLWDMLLGELFPYSPVDEDGCMPCKAVRKIIEEYHSPNLARSYAVTVFNMRGVYTPNAGKGEELLARKFEENAKKIELEFPHTAKIYYDISHRYKEMAEEERRLAEDV